MKMKSLQQATEEVSLEEELSFLLELTLKMERELSVALDTEE